MQIYCNIKINRKIFKMSNFAVDFLVKLKKHIDIKKIKSYNLLKFLIKNIFYLN